MTTPNFNTEAGKAGIAPSRRFNRRERKVMASVSNELAVREEAQLNIKYVSADINFATAGNRTVTDHGTGVIIPAGAIIVSLAFNVSEDIDSTSNNGTFQFFLGASSGGLALSSQITADDTNAQYWLLQSAVGGSSVTAAEVTLKVATNAIVSTSGIVSLMIGYVVP